MDIKTQIWVGWDKLNGCYPTLSEITRVSGLPVGIVEQFIKAHPELIHTRLLDDPSVGVITLYFPTLRFMEECFGHTDG